MKSISIVMLSAFVVLSLLIVPARAETIDAASCSESAVRNAIQEASAGDIVTIPAGTCTWGSTIVVSKPLQIMGAGIDATTIVDSGTLGGLWSLTGSGFIRLSGFTVSGTAGSYNGTVRIEGNNRRVDHIRFNLSNDRHAIRVSGNPSDVVIDNCVFDGSTRGINVFGSTSYWTDSSQYAPGTNYGVYIEDNVFNRRGVEVVDLNYGGAYVARYNTVANGGNFAVHGADSSVRSGGYVEIYNNQFVNPSSRVAMAVILRGGSAIIFDNAVTGEYNTAFNVQNWRTSYGLVDLPFHPDNQSRCEWGSSEQLDGKSSPNGWPCKDQFGRGPNQMSAPSYIWANAWDRGTATISLHNLGDATNPSLSDHIQMGRDYYLAAKPGYTPYAYPHPLRSVEGSDGDDSAPTVRITSPAP